MNYDKLSNAVVDSSFRTMALSQWMESKAERCQEIQAYMTEVIQDDVTNRDELRTKYHMTTFEIISADIGYVKVEELLDAIIADADTIIAYNKKGEQVGETDIDSVLSSFADSVASTVIASVATAAQAISGEVSDKVTTFTSRVQSMGVDIRSKYANTGAYFSNLLTLGLNDADFISNIENGMNVASIADDDTPDLAVNSDIQKMTGASPMGALEAASILGPIGVYFNIGAKIVGAAFKAIGKVGKKFFKKLKRWGRKLSSNPFDFTFVDDADDPVLDGYSFVIKGNRSLSLMHNEQLDAQSIIDITEAAYPVGSLIQQDLCFGSIFIKPKSYYLDVASPSNSTMLPYASYDIHIKPKAVTHPAFHAITKLISSYFSVEEKEDIVYGNMLKFEVPVNGDTFSDKLAAIINSMEVNPSSLESSESRIFNHFTNGLILTLFFYQLLNIVAAGDENYGTINLPVNLVGFSADDMAEDYQWPDERADSGSINNWDIVSGFSGAYETSPGLWSFAYINPIVMRKEGRHDANPIGITYARFPYMFTGMEDLSKHRVQLHLHPEDETAYLPYAKIRSFPSGKFRVLTDAQHQKAAEAALTVIVTAVAAVAITVSLGIAVKGLKKKAFMKATKTVGEIDNKIWNGVPLTKSETKKYLRAKKKLNRLDLFTTGSVDPGSISTPDNTDIITLIRS